MISLFFLIFLFLILIGLVLFLWIRERRTLKKKVSETMSESVWSEIVEEREALLRKRRAFREALEKAKKGR